MDFDYDGEMGGICNLRTKDQLLDIYRSTTRPTKQLEVNTEDNLQYKFYPVAIKCFDFEVKAAHDAHISLTSGPETSEPIIEIIIGGWNNSRSVIRKNRTKPEKSQNETTNILNGDEFRGFWVRWHEGTVSVGSKNESNAFLCWTDPEPFSISFVGLCTGWGATGSWKIEVPESYGTWQQAMCGKVPADAVVGGQDCTGELMYVAKATHDGVWTPGKLVTSHGCAYIPWRKKEHPKPLYQVLVGGPHNWVSTSGSNVPPDAFPAGQAEDGETLYVGRVRYGGSVTTGKVQRSHGVCYISFGGQELSFTDYEILMH